MGRFSGPDALAPGHVLDGFDCGVASLDEWLQRHARIATGAGSARTFVATDSDLRRVAGYHALTVASVKPEDAPERVVKGMPRHEIPAILLARLAVDSAAQGRGLGAWLLRDAMLRAVAVSEKVGIRAMLGTRSTTLRGTSTCGTASSPPQLTRTTSRSSSRT